MLSSYLHTIVLLLPFSFLMSSSPSSFASFTFDSPVLYIFLFLFLYLEVMCTGNKGYDSQLGGNHKAKPGRNVTHMAINANQHTDFITKLDPKMVLIIMVLVMVLGERLCKLHGYIKGSSRMSPHRWYPKIIQEKRKTKRPSQSPPKIIATLNRNQPGRQCLCRRCHPKLQPAAGRRQ